MSAFGSKCFLYLIITLLKTFTIFHTKKKQLIISEVKGGNNTEVELCCSPVCEEHRVDLLVPTVLL